MDIPIPVEIEAIIRNMNVTAPTIIYGGFLRDQYLGLPSNDIDIATQMNNEQILHLFPTAKVRTSVTGHQIFGFKFEGNEKCYLEISSTTEDLHQKAFQADYTMNSLIYDGSEMYDPIGGMEDLKRGYMCEVHRDILEHDFIAKPQLWLKTFRLQAKTGFSFSPTVFELINKYKNVEHQIDSLTKQAEGYKTIGGKYVLVALRSLMSCGLLPQFESDMDAPIFLQRYEHHILLCAFAIRNDLRLVQELCKFYQFPKNVLQKCETVYHAYYQTSKISNVKLKNQVLELRKILKSQSE